MNHTKIESAIRDLQQGKMIILTDHPDREDEGDLIFPAEKITPDTMNFMIRHSSGIICLSLTAEHLQQLNLPLMVPSPENTTPHHTSFTVSIDARVGITTGVSAADRARTIQATLGDNAKPDDFIKPGHVFPLRAKPGGVLERAGHTEGSIDIMRLAGFKPAAVMGELMNPDGSMMQGAQLNQFAEAHQFQVLSIEDIIQYRRCHENLNV
jgi:3,4-dihydroxy 2-butanone 4-phosphate synthase/GTP cyclohydrolase II